MENKEYIKALVFAAKNGNNQCFAELYQLFYEKVYALCLTTLKNAADAEDALQQTFINAWQNLGKLEDDSAFGTWIQRIAINQSYSVIRKRKPDFSVDEMEEEEGFDVEDEELELPQLYAERADLSIRLKLIINSLSDVQRQTLTLYYYSGLSVEEIANVMECSEGTVKSRLFLARRALKTEIEEQERKSGEKFYGAAMFPFGTIFIQQVKTSLLSKTAASSIFKAVAASGGFVVPAPVVPPAYQAPAPPAYHTPAPPVHNAPPVPNAHGATAAKAAGAAAKATTSVGKKVVAIIVAASIAVGGGIGTAVVLKNRNTKSETHVTSEADVENKGLRDTELKSEDEESLCKFFEYYLWGFSDDFDSANPDDYGKNFENGFDYNIISGIIGHPNGVNYELYPITPPRDLTENYSNEESYEKAEELGIVLEGGWIMEFDKESVYWVAENIFNLDEKTISSCIEERMNFSDEGDMKWNKIYSGKGSDGKDKYYIITGGMGGPGYSIDVTWVKTDGKKYYILYDEYIYGDILHFDSKTTNDYVGETHYAVMELKNIDGKEYWSVYKDTTDIPRDIFTADTPEIFEQVSGTYWRFGAQTGTEIKVYSDGTFHGIDAQSLLSDKYGGDGYLSYTEFSGKFGTPKKIDKHTYSVEIIDIQYGKDTAVHNNGPTEYDTDGRLKGFEKGKTLYFYVEGTPVTKMPEELVEGSYGVNADLNTDTGLKFPCMYSPESTMGYAKDTGNNFPYYMDYIKGYEFDF